MVHSSIVVKISRVVVRARVRVTTLWPRMLTIWYIFLVETRVESRIWSTESSTEIEIRKRCKNYTRSTIVYSNFVKLEASGRTNLVPSRKQRRVQSSIMPRVAVRGSHVTDGIRQRSRQGQGHLPIIWARNVTLYYWSLQPALPRWSFVLPRLAVSSRWSSIAPAPTASVHWLASHRDVVLLWLTAGARVGTDTAPARQQLSRDLDSQWPRWTWRRRSSVFRRRQLWPFVSAPRRWRTRNDLSWL